MTNQMSTKFNYLIDSWDKLKEAEFDYKMGMIDYGELIDYDYYAHECEEDFIYEIELQLSEK